MASNGPLRIRFLGDISFNDAYIDELESGKNPFIRMEHLLQDADLVVGNLECLIGSKQQNLQKKPRIGTTGKALDALNGLNLGLVSLATNHVYDNLEKGFENTVRKLDELGIAHLGASLNKEDFSRPFVFEKNGQKVGFINYVHPDTNPKIPTDAKVLVNSFDMDTVLSDIRELKLKVDRAVVLLHWGGKTDYGYFPHKDQISQARQMIDAGADAIIGHHTHTFQANMRYGGRPVFFSLGNFCFADIHCDGDVFKRRASGKKGAVLELAFEASTVKESVFPFRTDGLQLIPDPGLQNGFNLWQSLFQVLRSVPGAYAFYYYGLRRWEPVHFHAQLHHTTMLGLAFRKLQRIFTGA